MGRVLTPYRAGVTTDGLKHNKYRSRCFGRGACNRRAGGCDIHAAFDSPTGLIYPAMDTGHLTLRTNAIAREILVDKNTGKARGVAFVDRRPDAATRRTGRSLSLAASTLESARLMLLSKSTAHPNGIGNSSGHVGHNFCEHVMGPSVTGLVKDRVGKPRRSTTAGPADSTCRASGTSRTSTRISSGLRLRGQLGHEMFPGQRADTPGFGAAYKKGSRLRRRVHQHGRLRRSAGALRESRRAGSVRKDKWGIPVLRFHYQFGDNEKKMCEDMADGGAGDVRERRIRDRQRRSDLLTEGWSIHELGTARMGTDPKTSVLNQFQQSHDVKNLFVVDGSSHVSASCQNPTWTIMALAWRSCDYLVAEFGREPVMATSRRRRDLIEAGRRRAIADHRWRVRVRRRRAAAAARPATFSPAPSSRSSTSSAS